MIYSLNTVIAGFKLEQPGAGLSRKSRLGLPEKNKGLPFAVIHDTWNYKYRITVERFPLLRFISFAF